MQTFLPYADYELSALVLDRARLGKQRVENLQLMQALLLDTRYRHHPAAKMWRGYEGALLDYQYAICERWMSYGYADTCLQKTIDICGSRCEERSDPPPWLGYEPFHISHQSNLVRKNPDFYGRIFPDVPPDLEYIWPNTQENYMVAVVHDKILFDDARILFRNFSGFERQFNSAGDRNFCLLLDPKQAADMQELGFNIKYLKAREEGDEDQAYVKVKVNYKSGRPPIIVLVSSRGRNDLGMDEVGILDYADLRKVDLTISPYHYEIPGGNSGVTAYLSSGFFFINEDELQLRYADLPDANPTTSSSSTANEAAE